MLPANRLRLRSRAAAALFSLVVLFAVCGSLAFMKVRASTSQPEPTQSRRPVDAAAESADGSRAPDHLPRTSRSPFSRRLTRPDRAEGSENWYLVMAGIALLLALSGGIPAAARRFVPKNGAGALQIVSRASLSPKHSVYLLRAGTRVLLVGTGPQGAPALISELDEIPQVEPAADQGVEA